jgi:hypothetical protein
MKINVFRMTSQNQKRVHTFVIRRDLTIQVKTSLVLTCSIQKHWCDGWSLSVTADFSCSQQKLSRGVERVATLGYIIKFSAKIIFILFEQVNKLL